MKSKLFSVFILLNGFGAACGPPPEETNGPSERATERVPPASLDQDADPLVAGLYGREVIDENPAAMRGLGSTTLGAAATPGEAIVALASAERGRGPNEVGEDLGSYPHDLGRYLERDEAWCSEFVAWSYRAAGHPLSGGSENGGWMITYSQALRSWFQQHGSFISNGSSMWRTYTPKAGDYIRYNNSGGGHSGIVRYASGTTLYTVEGNVSNSVKLLTLTNWRDRSNIDGIGTRELGGQPDPTPDCRRGTLMAWDYCSEACPCEANQGDCDSDAECAPGLECKWDVGPRYGGHRELDVCEKP